MRRALRKKKSGQVSLCSTSGLTAYRSASLEERPTFGGLDERFAC